jgi:protein dpy-30
MNSQSASVADQDADPGDNENFQYNIRLDKELSNGKKAKVSLQSLPSHVYLERTVVPVMEGMSALAKERPPNPIEFMAAYLLKHQKQFEG